MVVGLSFSTACNDTRHITYYTLLCYACAETVDPMRGWCVWGGAGRAGTSRLTAYSAHHLGRSDSEFMEVFTPPGQYLDSTRVEGNVTLLTS